jgi:hypothetical protein
MILLKDRRIWLFVELQSCKYPITNTTSIVLFYNPSNDIVLNTSRPPLTKLLHVYKSSSISNITLAAVPVTEHQDTEIYKGVEVELTTFEISALVAGFMYFFYLHSGGWKQGPLDTAAT